MHADTTTIAGIEIPSPDPVFLSIVAVHVVFGLVGVVAGATAMLSLKQPGTQDRKRTPRAISKADLRLSRIVPSCRCPHVRGCGSGT